MSRCRSRTRPARTTPSSSTPGRTAGSRARPRLDVTFADIDITNGMAERGELDVLKVSYAVLPWVLDEYALLPCGGALGRGCGPLVLTREPGAGPGRARRSPCRASGRPRICCSGCGRRTSLPGGRRRGRRACRSTRSCRRCATARSTPDWSSTRPGSPTRTTGCTASPTWASTGSPRPGLPIPLGAIIAKRSLGAETLRAAGRVDPYVGPDGLGRPGGLPPVRPASTPRRWTRPSPTSTSGCTSTSSPPTSARTATRRCAGC